MSDGKLLLLFAIVIAVITALIVWGLAEMLR